MGLFNLTQGPSGENVKITFENVCAILRQEKYNEGIDADTTIRMIEDLYVYLTHNKDTRIRCPAPVSNPDDKFNMMWPEGAKVQSRPPSLSSSYASSHYRKSTASGLSSKYTTGNLSQQARSRVSSTVSSRRPEGRYVGIIDEEADNGKSELISSLKSSHAGAESEVKHRHRSRSSRDKSAASRHKEEITLRVAGAVVRPSASLEQIANGLDENEYDDKDFIERPAARQQRCNRGDKAKHVGFADQAE